jgi:hypothetical protein
MVMAVTNVLTGDTSNVFLYILIGVAIIGLIGLTLFPKLVSKDKDKDNGTGVMTDGDNDKTDEDNGSDDKK